MRQRDYLPRKQQHVYPWMAINHLLIKFVESSFNEKTPGWTQGVSMGLSKGEMRASSTVFKDNENPYFYCTLFLFSFRIGIDLGIWYVSCRWIFCITMVCEHLRTQRQKTSKAFLVVNHPIFVMKAVVLPSYEWSLWGFF